MRHKETHRDKIHDDMVLLTTSDVCLYLCVALSTLTLVESLIKHFILISRIEECRMGSKEREQEGRPGLEPGTPLCLPQL